MSTNNEPQHGSWPVLLRAGATTAFLLAVLAACRWVPLRGVRIEDVSSFIPIRTSLAILGISPLLNGFILVELLSFTPPGRRVRRGGFAGRARLDRAALLTSLAVAALQATGMAISLESMVSRTGEPFVAHPGAFLVVLTVATLTAATAALFILATTISRRGIGNGFCWLLAWPVVEAMTSGWHRQVQEARGEPTDILFGLLCVVPLVALAVWLQRQRYRIAAPAPDGEPLRLRLPALPQGALPAGLAVSLLGGLAVFRGTFSWASWLPAPTLTVIVAGCLLLIPALSYLTFHLFGSARRVAANLGSLSPAERDLHGALGRQLILTTASLAAGAIAGEVLARFVPRFPAIQFYGVLVLTAIGLDLWHEIAFLRRHRGGSRLLQLDNVHLACYLEALLRQHGIAGLARGYHFRSLYYFLNPLVKMDLLVPASRLEEARALIPAAEIAIV